MLNIIMGDVLEHEKLMVNMLTMEKLKRKLWQFY
jgi:hypothetical protein